MSIVSEQYQLVAGPYRTALWAMLSRFKTRFVADISRKFCSAGDLGLKAESIDRAIEAFEASRLVFLDSRDAYRGALTESINALRMKTNSLHEIDATKVAATRINEIEHYINSTIGRWKERAVQLKAVPQLDEQYRYKIAEVVSASVWPYYADVYWTSGKHNIATWVQKVEQLEQPYIVRIGDTNLRLENERLYPTLMPFVDDDAASCIDAASDAFLDFENPDRHDPVGLVQPFDFTDRPARLIYDHHLEKPQTLARFIDLYFFNDDSIPLTIRTGELPPFNPSNTDEEIGVLFLVSLSLESVFALALEEDEMNEAEKRKLIHNAWIHSGGIAFSREFHNDLKNLRRMLKELEDSTAIAARASVQAVQSAAWAHDVKNWTAPIITGLDQVIRQLRMLNPAPAPAIEFLRRVRLNARCLNAASLGLEHVFRNMNDKHGGASTKDGLFAGHSEETARNLIEGALQLLLMLQSETKDDVVLQWQPCWKKEELDNFLFREFAVPGTRRELVADVLDVVRLKAPFSIIVAFLREVVQNIRISKVVCGANEIAIGYRIDNSDRGLALRLHQESLDAQEWQNPESDGIDKAKRLYGPEGANLGDIEVSGLRCEPQKEGKKVVAYKISYDLTVHFFLSR